MKLGLIPKRLRGLGARLRRKLLARKRPANFVDRDPRTPEHWRRQFAGDERTMECGQMQLIGRDHEGAVFTGPGRIVIDERGIRFFLYGSAEDGAAAFRKLLAARANRYETLDQFRLVASDYRGTTWTGGYTEVDYFIDHDRGWPLTGELQGLSTRVSDFWVARSPGVEMLLMPPIDLPMDEALETSAAIGGEPVRWSRGAGRQRLRALGSEISFEVDPSEKALWITASMSPDLQPVFAERWLTEPLRIMLGALIYPRLIARNYGDGSADVTFLPAPTKRRPSAFGLMQPFVADSYPGRAAEFWALYAGLLTMIGRARDEHGHPNLESHEVTRLYEELIQTQNASRWIITMTLAGTVEALAGSLMSDDDRRSEYAPDAIDSLREHLRAWPGDANLRSRILGNLTRAGERSVYAFMRNLGRGNALDPTHVETWRRVRNSVMHGELTEPWSTEEGDRHVAELIALVHALTRLRITKP